MNPNFVKKLSLWIYKNKVNTQNIDSSKLNTFGILIASLLVEDKEERSRFFEKKFLLADISIDITLGIPFLTLSNVKINFVDCHLY